MLRLVSAERIRPGYTCGETGCAMYFALARQIQEAEGGIMATADLGGGAVKVTKSLGDPW